MPEGPLLIVSPDWARLRHSKLKLTVVVFNVF